MYSTIDLTSISMVIGRELVILERETVQGKNGKRHVFRQPAPTEFKTNAFQYKQLFKLIVKIIRTCKTAFVKILDNFCSMSIYDKTAVIQTLALVWTIKE